MRQSIVIATTPSTNEQLVNLLSSLHGYDSYPIIIYSDYSYEIGKIKRAAQDGYDEFFLLQDTIEVKDPYVFSEAFEKYRGRTVTVDPTMRSFLCKYRKSFLDKLELPIAKTKLDAVDAEDWLFREHAKLDKTVACLMSNFNKSNVFEEKFGRENMVLENEYFKKYKGTWSRSQLA